MKNQKSKTEKNSIVEETKIYPNTGILNFNYFAVNDTKHPFLVGTFTDEKGEEKTMRLWNILRVQDIENKTSKIIYSGNYTDKDVVFKRSANNACTIKLYPYKKVDLKDKTKEEKIKY